MLARGANENEVIETIETSDWFPAKENKMQCKKIFYLKIFLK